MASKRPCNYLSAQPLATDPAHREDVQISFSPAKKGAEGEKRLAWLKMKCYL